MPGTIVSNDDFDVDAAAESLHESMRGLGTDEETIIECLCKHSLEQRLEIAEVYKTSYGKDIIEDLKSELGGDFEDTVLAFMTPLTKLHAITLHRAVCGVGTDEDIIIGIMCSCNNEELEDIKETYATECENSLEEDLKSDTAGYFSRLLVSLCACGRDVDEEVNWHEAEQCAQKLLEAGANTLGTDEIEFNVVLARKSYGQLKAIFEKYEELAGHSLEEDIVNETSSDLREGYLAIVDVAKNVPRFFAKLLNKAMCGMGTSDDLLIHVIVSRSEIDLQEIKQEYAELYETSLWEAIESECSGDYKRMLLSIVQQ